MALCSTTDVKGIIDTVGRWTGTQVASAIDEVDEFIYDECGYPLAASWCEIGKVNDDVQERYYVGEPKIYDVEKVFYGTTTKVELVLGTGYKKLPSKGMIEILPYASSAITTSVDCDIEVWYVPGMFHKLSIFRSCKQLLEEIDTTSGGDTSKELTVIDMKLGRVEKVLNDRVGLSLSSDIANYDKTYGINKKKVIQDHDRNLYLASSGDSWEYS